MEKFPVGDKTPKEIPRESLQQNGEKTLNITETQAAESPSLGVPEIKETDAATNQQQYFDAASGRYYKSIEEWRKDNMSFDEYADRLRQQQEN